MNIFGTVQPKPVYRDNRGCFRKETKREYRARHDSVAWSNVLMRRRVAKVIASTNPYAALTP